MLNTSHAARMMLAALLLSALTSSCKKDDDPSASSQIQCTTSGLNADNTKYSTVIVDILQRNTCFSCHSTQQAQGGVVLEGYNNIKKYVDNDKLLGTIAHLSGYKAMPQGSSKMAQDDICKIKYWVDSGAPNN
ncbi:MAG TPA: hypothetical protein PK971_12515 [Saprospiraceae bacterium]|nr:hypothetical protein [Saprospiraceae bacterium]HNG90020.1 hypothetical protein [Saprospiraceae bacterium]